MLILKKDRTQFSHLFKGSLRLWFCLLLIVLDLICKLLLIWAIKCGILLKFINCFLFFPAKLSSLHIQILYIEAATFFVVIGGPLSLIVHPCLEGGRLVFFVVWKRFRSQWRIEFHLAVFLLYDLHQIIWILRRYFRLVICCGTPARTYLTWPLLSTIVFKNELLGDLVFNLDPTISTEEVVKLQHQEVGLIILQKVIWH